MSFANHPACSRLRKRIVLIAGILVLMLTSLELHTAAVWSSPEEENRPPHRNKPYGGTLTIGTANKPTFINPILTNVSVSASIVSLLFNGLIRLNPKGELEPDLATSWDISPDALVYIFHLREDVFFHDGVPFTAKDVKFTYDAIADPAVKSPYSLDFQIIKSFDVLDPHTFRVVLKEQHAPILIAFARQIILPKHIYEGTDIGANPFNYKPVGTGPFQFEEWTAKDQITLGANLNYFEGRPYLDEVIYKTYPNRSEVWSAFMRGEVDLIKFMSVENYELTKADPAFNAFAHPSVFYYGISYNLNDPALSDIRVRDAVTHAINRQKIIEQVEGGYGIECQGPFSPDSWAFNPEVKPFHYDPREAVRILKEAGWEDADKNGVLEKNGSELTIRLLVDARNPDMKKIAMLIRQQLQEIGIKILLDLYENEAVLTKEYLSKKKSNAHLRFFVGGTHDPHEAIKLWHSRDHRIGKVWVENAPNLDIDRLIELGERTQVQIERQKIYRELHKKIHEDQSTYFLYYPYVFHAASNKIGNADSLFKVWMPDYIIKDFYIKEE